jgi:hypothetical protein
MVPRADASPTYAESTKTLSKNAEKKKAKALKKKGAKGSKN